MAYIPEKFKNGYINFILDLHYSFGIKDYDILSSNIQIGGNKHKIIQFIDIGGVYTFNVYIDDSDVKYIKISVLSSDENDCITIIIIKEEHLAILHNMSYYDNCAREGLGRPGGGNKLLRFALNLILSHKEKYNIKKILLKDNSFLYCKGFEHTIKLAQLRMFTHGSPWYASYGFKPYDVETKKESKNLIKILENSKETINVLKTNTIDILSLIENEKLKINIDEITILIKKYPLMKNLLKALSNNFDKYCRLIYYILDSIYKRIPMEKLGNFHEKTFILSI